MIRRLLLKSRRDVRASLAQSIALIVIVALGITSLAALLGAYRDLSTSYNHTYDELRFADVTFSLAKGDASAVAAIKNIDGVEGVTGRLVLDSSLTLPPQAGTGDEQVRSRLIGIPADSRPEVNDLLVEQGSYFQKGASSQALVETHFADFYKIAPGDKVTPIINGLETSLNVTGIVASPEYLIVSPSKQDILPSPRTFAVLFLPLADLQQLTGNRGVVNNIAVTFTAGADADTLTARIKDTLKPYVVTETTPRSNQPSFAALNLDLEGFREMAYIMPALILLVAAASVFILLSRMVRAQQPQIGVMKAIGYGNSAIALQYLAIAFFIGLIGSVLGVLGSFPLERWITGLYAGELGIPLVKTSVHYSLLITGVVVSVVITALAGLGPSLSVSRMAPAQAMHTDPASAQTKGRISFFEKLLPLPLWLKLSLRNVFRVRRRALSTALGVVFSFMLLLMSWGMITSINYMLDHNFQDVERWDVMAGFNKPQGEETLKKIESLPGVTKAEPYLRLPVTLAANNKEQEIILTAIAPDQTLHVLDLGSDTTQKQALADGKIVLTTASAGMLDVREGDTVTITTSQGSRTLTVSALTDELMSAVAYISLAQLGRWTGQTTLIFNGVNVTTGPGQAQDVKNSLGRLPDNAGAQLKSGIRQDWQQLMNIYYAFMGVIMAFGIAMSFALLFNTMTINVLEQQRELATMRSVGASRGRIASILTYENIIIWLLALVPGLLLGYWITSRLAQTFNTDIFSMTVYISTIDYVITALGILAVMILAALPAIRRVNRINLAEATKIL
ncbi:outer membrane-specific lipoprotein transporter subunit LolE [bacterium BMS3Abin01]|nr:outer membrane-specific lipoprotein transporter subunit LolE [bacterium BMS3Abin01]